MKKIFPLTVSLLCAFVIASSLGGCSAPANEQAVNPEGGGASPVQTGRTPTESAFFAACEAIGADPAHNTVNEEIELYQPGGSTDASIQYIVADDTITVAIDKNAGVLFAAMKPFLDNQDVQLILDCHYLSAKTDNYQSWDWSEKLQDIRFNSLELILYGAGESDLEFLADIENLTSLCVDVPGGIPSLPDFPTLETLGMDVSLGAYALYGETEERSFSFDGLERQPALKTLVLSNSSGLIMEYQSLSSLSLCNTLVEISFIASSWKGEDLGDKILPTDAPVFETALLCPNIQTLQGVDITKFDLDKIIDFSVSVSLGQRAALKWARELVDAYKEGTLPEKELPSRLEGKVIVVEGGMFSFGSNFTAGGASLDAAVEGKDYGGIPNARLASSIEECSYIIYVSSERGTLVGYYDGGGSAFKGLTTVTIIDVATRSVGQKIVVSTADPPESISRTPETRALGAVGPDDPEAARAYVAGLL
jgi:hypothetical protein